MKLQKETIEISMELIGIAGEARGIALRALVKARKGNIDEARELAKQAKETINMAHKLHAKIISKEAQGEEWDIKTLFIHSQDHFTAGLVICDLVDFIIDSYVK